MVNTGRKLARELCETRQPGSVSETMDTYNGTTVAREARDNLFDEIVGANPEAKKAYMFGIDRIDLKPSK